MATIGTNIAAVSAASYLTTNNNNLTSDIQELSSGSRLANPVNDAAGVAVAGNLNARIERLNAAVNGAQDLISFATTTDGFLSTLQSITTRLSELTQEMTNGAFSSTDRANYQTEAEVLTAQFCGIVLSANFDGVQLLSGTAVSNNITTTIDADGNTDVFNTSFVTNQLAGVTGNILGYFSNVGLSNVVYVTNMISQINAAITSITTARAHVNADISKFNFYVQNLQTTSTNLQAAESTVNDLNVAQASTDLSKQNILVQASTAMLAQANTAQQSILTLLR